MISLPTHAQAAAIGTVKGPRILRRNLGPRESQSLVSSRTRLLLEAAVLAGVWLGQRREIPKSTPFPYPLPFTLFGRATFLFGHEGGIDAPVVTAAKQGFGYTLVSIGVFVAVVLFVLAMFKAEWIGLS